MRLSPLLLEKLEAATQSGIEQGVQPGIEQGIQQGIQQGMQQGLRMERTAIIENLLRVRFNSLDDQLRGISVICAVLGVSPMSDCIKTLNQCCPYLIKNFPL
ncbi:hypothetical protein [Moorena sp. SIO4G3]|uniref:hypothetical protein n=1 Tax=Moorena sp. SIO4G3 TaxID=2607821 RepID=UPI00142926E6|nr:hypothetical protein [Moorena sp. SIO4G3]NEO82644.1 hypothetical protein [Moorena sp. SIO4G3]